MTKQVIIFTVQKTIEILSNLDSIDEDDVFEKSTDWEAIWRGMFKKVTPEDIEEYLKKFRGICHTNFHSSPFQSYRIAKGNARCEGSICKIQGRYEQNIGYRDWSRCSK